MWGRHGKLLCLCEELESITVLDRLHEYATDSNRNNDAYVTRQARRAEILAEITNLEAKRPWFEAHARVFSVALLLCTTAYATFHFLLK
jgi:hypothetical protein